MSERGMKADYMQSSFPVRLCSPSVIVKLTSEAEFDLSQSLVHDDWTLSRITWRAFLLDSFWFLLELETDRR
jgi:hypothetical protein